MGLPHQGDEMVASNRWLRRCAFARLGPLGELGYRLRTLTMRTNLFFLMSSR